MANNIYQYYVEGENEERVINALKSELRCIRAGKVAVFDVIKRRMPKNKLMQLKQGTIIVLVFDTDTTDATILKRNIEMIKSQRFIKDVICVTQVQNLEDELERSCNIKNAKELTGSKSVADYKKALNKEKNLGAKLSAYAFNINKFWTETPTGAFRDIANDSNEIKL